MVAIEKDCGRHAVATALSKAPSFRGVRSANPESISLPVMPPDGFRARAQGRAPE